MIFAEWKPLEELIENLKGHKKVLLAGCATCVAECAAGGEKEVETLAPLLSMALKETGNIKNRAADKLGISFRSLRYRLDQHGIKAN